MDALHFIRTTPMPDAVRDWHRLAQFVAQLRGSRARTYPAMIADGRISASDAATRLRIITAIAAQWDAVLRGDALPDVPDYAAMLGATAAEMREELADVAQRAAARAAADPASRKLADQAMLAAALHWHQQPTEPDCAHPHIWQAHDFHQWQRQSRARNARAA